MPKSKHRKFNPRPTAARPASTTAATPAVTSASVTGAVLTNAATASRKSGQTAAKGPPVEQLRFISNELVVIGILTTVMVIAIIVLYFVLK
ncbi:MAG TPA: hypothetical protein VEI27_01895 [Dehalococcoidales bacterium]|nr:hypothetical protein [Dehalococcoidales bacterium]